MWMREPKASSISPGRLVVNYNLTNLQLERGLEKEGILTKRIPSKYSSSRRKIETSAFRWSLLMLLSCRKTSASSSRRIAFHRAAYSKTSLIFFSSVAGSIPRSPQLTLNSGRFSLSATDSAFSGTG